MARRIDESTGREGVRAALGGSEQCEHVATAVRYLLQVLAEAAPGRTVEVRVPPYGAVQAVSGPQHTRGTPPHVVETDAATWLSLATGALGWEAAIAQGRVSASGARADLDALLPLDWDGPARP